MCFITIFQEFRWHRSITVKIPQQKKLLTKLNKKKGFPRMSNKKSIQKNIKLGIIDNRIFQICMNSRVGAIDEFLITLSQQVSRHLGLSLTGEYTLPVSNYSVNLWKNVKSQCNVITTVHTAKAVFQDHQNLFNQSQHLPIQLSSQAFSAFPISYPYMYRYIMKSLEVCHHTCKYWGIYMYIKISFHTHKMVVCCRA